MKKWPVTKNLRIQPRFFIYFTTFALVPAVILGIVLGIILLGNRAENTRMNIAVNMDNSVQRLNEILNEALQIGLTVSEDKDIIDIMNRQESDEEAVSRNNTEVSNSLMRLSSYFDDDIQVYLFSMSGKKAKSSSASFLKEDYLSEEWFQHTLETEGRFWTDLYQNSCVVATMKEEYISVGIPMVLPGSSSASGVIFVEVCIEDILTQDLRENKEGIWFIYDPDTTLSIENGVVKQYEDEKITVLSSESGGRGQSFNEKTAQELAEHIPYWSPDFQGEGSLSESGYRIFYKSIPVNNWILVYGISDWDYDRPLYIMGVFLIAFFSAIILSALYISNYAARNVTRPILELKESAEQVQNGNFDVQIRVNSEDEIGQLSEQFSLMITHIRELMDNIVEKQKIQRNYELMLLNAQINPHFLYNTLDSLLWLIRIKRLDDAEEMLQALTNFFKTGLNKGKDIISLKTETENVRSYLAIQKLRYKSLLNYEIFLDPQAEEIQLPKLILQPLVENSIYHGIKPKESGGNISVWIFLRDGDLTIQVTDNGIGMDENEINILTGEIEAMEVNQRESYGLENVNERMHLYYGDRYSLEIESKKMMGTQVTIRIRGALDV